jgi:hypothetical protein
MNRSSTQPRPDGLTGVLVAESVILSCAPPDAEVLR